MRLYVSPFAPNALKVQIVAAEKHLTPDLVDVTADRRGYLAIKLLGQVPALLLDDGRVLTETRVIAEYLDGLSGPPYLFGDDPAERARGLAGVS